MKKAEEMLLKAIANDEQFGNYTDLGVHKTNLGSVYFEQSRFDEAKAVFSEVLVIAKKAGLKEIEVRGILYELSRIERVKK